MHHYINIIKEKDFTESEIDVCLWHSAVGLLESETNYTTFENVDGNQVLRLELHKQLDEFESDELADAISKNLQEMGVEGLEVEISNNDPDEETYDGDSFYEAYGDMWYSEDESLDEAEYRGRKVSLGKPMRGDVKKFKVFVRDPKTKNIKKVNFGDPNMRIKNLILQDVEVLEQDTTAIIQDQELKQDIGVAENGKTSRIYR